MLLLPICSKLEKLGFNRIFAIISCILIFLTILIGIIYLFTYQIIGLSKNLPFFANRIQEVLLKLKDFIAENTRLSHNDISSYIESSIRQIVDSLGSYIQSVLTITTGVIVNFFLVLIYIAFFLAYRERIENFILKIAPENEKEKTDKIIKSCTSMSISYLSGILTVSFILSVSNAIALTIFRIEYALFFAVLAGILNIIPFVGTFLGSILPVALALLTKDSIWVAVFVVIYFTVIQYIESYFLTPFIVGGKVRVNPLTEILALVLGGVIWGVAGMVLFIPLTGLVKVLFDHIEKFEPFAYVIGREDVPKTSKTGKKIKYWFKK